MKILLTNNSYFVDFDKYDVIYTDSPYLVDKYPEAIYLNTLLDDNYHQSIPKIREKGLLINQAVGEEFFAEYMGRGLTICNIKRDYTNVYTKVYKLLKLQETYKDDIIDITITQDELYDNSKDIDRFENMYYRLADKYNVENINLILENDVFRDDLDVRDVPVDSWFLRLINLDLSVLWFNLLKKFKLFSSPKRKVYIYKSNNSIREIEPHLHKLGFSYEQLPELYSRSLVESNPNNKPVIKTIVNDCFGTKNKYEELFALYVEDYYTNLVNKRQSWEKQVKKSVPSLKQSNKYILTNTINDFDSFTTAKVLQDYGFKIIDVMHGITNSYLIENDFLSEDECLAPDMLLCFNKSEERMFKKVTPEKPIYPISTVYESKNYKLYFLQRKYVENMLSLKSSINVFYPSLIFAYNNYSEYGYRVKDEDNQVFEKDMIDILSDINKHAIYKKYPRRHYIDANPFDEYAEQYSNISVIGGKYDFRYISTVGDVFILAHLGGSSTITWMLGLDKPIVYLHTDRYRFINDEAKKIVYECFLVVNIDDSDWQKQLQDLLNKPYEELVSLWNQKKKYRDLHDEEWLMGNNMHAGELGAKYIEKFING